MPPMATTIAVLSQKGGTGKTTMTRTLSDVFARLGLDVLAIDADPQGNLSDYFDTDPDAHPTLAEVLQGQVRAADAVHGPVIPANMRLAESELMLAGKIGREVTLRNALRELKRERDLILIDCPPTLGLLTVNALVAADHAILTDRGAVLLAAGRRAGDGGGRPRPRLAQPRARAARAWCSTSPTCGPSTRARRSRRCASASATSVCRTVIRQSIAYAESAERADPDPRLPARPRRRLPLARRRAAAPARRARTCSSASTSSRPSSSRPAPAPPDDSA